jgi:hypothetical protein
MYTIVTGNPLDGIELYGLFETRADAEKVCDEHFHKIDWWIVKIKEV